MAVGGGDAKVALKLVHSKLIDDGPRHCAEAVSEPVLLYSFTSDASKLRSKTRP
jgi:hypothetical protein